MQELVSIIVPTHNRAGLIGDTLDSLLAQRYSPIEIIIVNDHSDDDTQEVVDRYVSNYPGRISLVNSPSKGACSARNYGVSQAKGDFIQFFDDDDLVDPDYIGRRIDAIRESGADYAGCNYRYFDNTTGNVIREVDICSLDHTIESHLYHTAMTTQCFLMTRECFGRIGLWNEKIRRCQDMAFFHRLFLNGCTGTWVDAGLFSLRVHEKQISSESVKSTVALIDAYQAIKEEWRGRGNKRVFNVLTYMQLSAIKRLFALGAGEKAIYQFLRVAFLRPGDVCRIFGKGIRQGTLKLTYEMLVG